MRKITFVKNSTCDHVRLLKFNQIFKQNDIYTSFIGWNRRPKIQHHSQEKYDNVNYIFEGGDYGGNKLVVYYVIWFFKIFFWNVFRKKETSETVFVVDFDSAFPIYLSVKLGVKCKYIYDIHDDFALRYRWPNFVKRLITRLDYQVKKHSLITVHVDENRVRPADSNYVIIHNTPVDIFTRYQRPVYEPVIAAIGHLSVIRGLEQIVTFAEKHDDIKLLIIGRQLFDKAIEKRIENSKNIIVHDAMPQSQLFDLIKNCSGIYSLYDPSIEINRKAASNKLYDGMMLGIPVIVNSEIEAKSMIEEYRFGFIVSYEMDETWDKLYADLKNTSLLAELGSNGRILYEQKYNFQKRVQDTLLKTL